ncbi:hypothetical protein [Streptomyces sp. E2N171]|uniref:hypothetical protein n=1 Tax=Streptomyces sp. E2N171 TaxID=1851914 RepID=UPI0012915797|nr:hypothetical protein [Streptomyces sp. E2N171]
MTRLPSYRAIHQRLRRLNGPASHHACDWCGRTADHWAYNHADENEIYAERLWSLDPEHYRPMCRKCHQRLDSNFRAVGHDQRLLAERVKHLRAQAWSAVTDEQRACQAHQRAAAIRAHDAFVRGAGDIRQGEGTMSDATSSAGARNRVIRADDDQGLSLTQVDEISLRIFKELGELVGDTIGPDGKMSEAAQAIYHDVAGDASVFPTERL